MKDKVKTITIALTFALLLMIPMLNDYANLSRPEPKYGGECIMWMLPGLLYLLFKEFYEMKGEWKDL